MYTVGLDKLKCLILYSQESSEVCETKIEKSTKDKVKFISFSSDTKEILFGSLLGDGKLEMSARSVNSRFGFTQAEYKRDYFISVLNSLSSISTGKYREYFYYDKRTNNTYKSLNF